MIPFDLENQMLESLSSSEPEPLSISIGKQELNLAIVNPFFVHNCFAKFCFNLQKFVKLGLSYMDVLVFFFKILSITRLLDYEIHEVPRKNTYISFGLTSPRGTVIKEI